MEEGRVASFLLGTTAILQLRYAIIKKKMLLEVDIWDLFIFLSNYVMLPSCSMFNLYHVGVVDVIKCRSNHICLLKYCVGTCRRLCFVF